VGTAAGGSGGPLRRTGRVCNLLRTGWGPRGDSGSARGRVRATQPASLPYLNLQSLRIGQNHKYLSTGQFRFHLLLMLPSKCVSPTIPDLLVFLSSLTNFTMQFVSLVSHALPATLKSFDCSVTAMRALSASGNRPVSKSYLTVSYPFTGSAPQPQPSVVPAAKLRSRCSSEPAAC
jgi:hypothetical protein